MFEAYNVALKNYSQNDNITFDSVRFSDCRIKNTNGSTFTITTPGRYYVIFGGIGASGTATSPFTVQLYSNDLPVPAVLSTITSATAGDEQTLSFATIIDVRPSCCAINNNTKLQVKAISEEAGTIANANLIIFKLR